MQVVSQEISAGCSTVAIKDSKERALRPVLPLPRMWLQNVENDWHTVLIIVSDYSFIRVGSICSHNSIFLVRALRLVHSSVWNLARQQKVWQDFLVIWIVQRIVDQILANWPLMLSDWSDLTLCPWQFACVHVIKNLSHDLLLPLIFDSLCSGNVRLLTGVRVIHEALASCWHLLRLGNVSRRACTGVGWFS